MLQKVRLVFFILFFSLFPFIQVQAQSAVEKGGKVILDLDTKNPDESGVSLSFSQQIANMVRVGAYFNEEYPGHMIFWDFTEDMRKFFPNLDGNELDNRVMFVRDAVRLYRFGRDLYERVKQKILLPEDPPLVYADEDYEIPQKRLYIESDDLVVVNDFKKVVSYSSEKKDLDAYAAKAQRERLSDKSDTSSPIKRINDMFAKVGWREFFFPTNFTSDPLTDGKGLGSWVVQDDVKVRLESEYSTVNFKNTQKALIHFYIPDDKVLRLDGEYAPTINLSGNNLASWRANLPIFDRVSLNGKSYIGRQGHVPLVFSFTVENSDKPLGLEAQIEAFLCSVDTCKKYLFAPKLFLENEFGYSSLAYNFIHQSFLRLPQHKLDSVHLLSLSSDENSSELRLRIKTDENPSQMDVLVSGNGFVSNQPPRLSVYGDIVEAFIPVPHTLFPLIGKSFEVIVKLSSDEAVQKTMVVESTPSFDILGSELSWGLILAALFGGFLLNFMPCVFPVLALKLMSIVRFGEAQREKIKRNFFYTTVGLFGAFSLLIFVLLVLKFSGAALGWGIQFQKPWFLVSMIFVVIVFEAYVLGFVNVFSWRFMNFSKSLSSSDKWHFILVGALLVLMSTPCMAPYLGTAIGFALGGSYWDIVLVLYAVALGLSLPYVFVLFVPDVVYLLPKPGKWMSRFELFMKIMLFLTLIWLFSVLAAQVSLFVVFRTLIYSLVFFLLLWLAHKSFLFLETISLPSSLRLKKKKQFGIFFVVVSAFLFCVSVWDVSKHFEHQIPASVASKIDTQKIRDLLAQGKSVLLKVDARWCLTCQFNDFTVLNTDYIQDKMKLKNMVVMTVDWTSYDSDILDFMKKYGRSGIPFYILFSSKFPNGMVLPEILTEQNFSAFLDSYSSSF